MAYERVNWENLPSTNTPVNATNLNKLNDVIDAKANSNDVYTKTETDTKLNKKVNTSDLIDLIYPVGSIYMSANNVSPANLFGGKWEQIKDTFLLACGDTYKNGETGGEATHTLTIDEMPVHNHDISTSGDNNMIWTKIGSCQSGTGVSCVNDWGNGLHIENSGGGQPHNNMPPYLAVFVWKRTA